tara:strand:+ start:528 stop:1718 length:1191 start_codon:yes stop_codon:yes gene_type:complete
MLPDASPQRESLYARVLRLLKTLKWQISKWNTKRRLIRYLKALSNWRSGDLWWEQEVGFPAKPDSQYSEDIAAIFLRAKKGSGRGKGDDLNDGTEVKSVATLSTTDARKKFTMFKDWKSSDKVKALYRKFMNEPPRHIFVIIDHPPPDENWDGSWLERMRVRIYAVHNLHDGRYREFMNGNFRYGNDSIQIQTDHNNRANGKLCIDWRENPDGVVADPSVPEIFGTKPGKITLPKVFEAVQRERDSDEWDITLFRNPFKVRLCQLGANFRLDDSNQKNPWSKTNLEAYCQKVGVSTGEFTEDELREILTPLYPKEKLHQFSMSEMKSLCQAHNVPSIKDMGINRFLGQRVSRKADYERGGGIDKRAAQLYRLHLKGHPLFDWKWRVEYFDQQEEEQ